MASKAVLDLIVSLKDEATSKLASIGSGIANVGKIAVGAGLAVGGALVTGLGAAVSMASDAQEMMSKFNVVFANTGGAVAGSLDQFAASVGRSKFELREMASVFGDTLKPMGFAEGKAADLSVQMSQLATDLSSFNNIPMDEALQKLQGTLIGNHENALAFGVIINENTLKAELAANGWDKLTGVQLEQAKVQARINLLMRGTTDAQGDAARTATGWANIMRRLQATLSDTAIEIGSKFLPVLTPLLDGFVNLAQRAAPAVIAVAERMAGALQKIIQQVSFMFGAFQSGENPFAVFEDGSSHISTILEALGMSEETSNRVGVAIKELADGAMWGFQLMKDAVTTFQQAFAGNWVDSDIINPFHRVVGVIGLVAAAFQEGGIQAALATLLPYIQTAFAGLLAWVQAQLPVWAATLLTWGQAFVDWVTPYIPILIAKAQELGTALLGWVQAQAPVWLAALLAWGQAFVDWITPMIPPLLAQAQALATQFLAWIVAQAGPLVESFLAWKDAFLAWIVPATAEFLMQWPGMLESFLAWIGEAAGPILLKLGDWALSFLAWIIPMIPDFLVAVGAIAGALLVWLVETSLTISKTIITEWIPAFLDWILTDLVPRLAPALEAAGGKIIGWIRTAASAVVTEAGKIGKGIIDGIINGITGAAGGLVDAARGAAQSAAGAIKGFFGIHSPSKLMEEYGGYIGEGLASGITRAAAGAMNAARSLSADVAGAMSPAPSLALAGAGAGGGAPLPAPGGLGGRGPVTIIINMPGLTIANGDNKATMEQAVSDAAMQGLLSAENAGSRSEAGL